MDGNFCKIDLLQVLAILMRLLLPSNFFKRAEVRVLAIFR